MKIHTIIICFLLFYIPLFGQTKIDENVSIEIPGKVHHMDTVTNNASVSSFYSNSKTDSYLVMRMAVMSNGNEVQILPVDSSGLKRIYNQIIGDQIKSMGKKGFLLRNTQEIKIKDYLAYRISYKTVDSQNQSGETLLLCLNGIAYVFTYSRADYYIEKHKNEFQNSLKINSLAKQIATVKTDSKGGFSFADLISYGVIGFVLIIFFYRKTRQKSPWGINLKPIYCPSCQTKQPFIRKPANQRQALWGGHTCSKCKIEMDKYGVVITPEN
jgi:hypothetical protein